MQFEITDSLVVKLQGFLVMEIMSAAMTKCNDFRCSSQLTRAAAALAQNHVLSLSSLNGDLEASAVLALSSTSYMA